jgi:hypothetical protein
LVEFSIRGFILVKGRFVEHLSQTLVTKPYLLTLDEAWKTYQGLTLWLIWPIFNIGSKTFNNIGHQGRGIKNIFQHSEDEKVL